jgi:DNA-binding XRE family transcriptional regulator
LRVDSQWEAFRIDPHESAPIWRFRSLQRSLESAAAGPFRAANRGFGITLDVKLSDLPTHEDVLAGHLDADPEYRREWARTALARAVAVMVIGHRTEHGLSQTALAKRLGMSQPAVARLESGAHNPAFPVLLRICAALGIELMIDIAPAGREPQLIGARARREALESFRGDGCTVVVAATSAI